MLSWRALLVGLSRAPVLSMVVGRAARLVGAVAGRVVVGVVVLLGFVVAEAGRWLMGVLVVVVVGLGVEAGVRGAGVLLAEGAGFAVGR